MAVVGVASFVLLVTVLPQIAGSIGLSSLANRLTATAGCSSSGSSSASSSSGCSSSTTTVYGAVQGTVTVKNVPAGAKIKEYVVTACPAATPWLSGSPPPLCVSEATNAKHGNTYSITHLVPGLYTLYPGYVSKTSSYVRMKVSGKPTVTILPNQTTTKNMTVKYHK